MSNFRNIFGMLAVLAILAMATAPPVFAIGVDTADIVYLSDLNDNDLTVGANPYEGDILALATSASGMKSDFAAGDVSMKTAYIPVYATKGGDATASGTEGFGGITG